MFKSFVCFLLIVLLGLVPLKLRSQSKKDSISYRADLKYLYAGLVVFHPGVQSAKDTMSLKSSYKKLRNQITSKTSPVAFKQLAGRLLKVIKDGHTGFTLGNTAGLRMLPFEISYNSEQYFIKNSKSPLIMKGSTITHLGDWGIDSLYTLYRSYLSIGDQDYDLESNVRHTRYLSFVNLIQDNLDSLVVRLWEKDSSYSVKVPVYSAMGFEQEFGFRDRRKKALALEFLNDSVVSLKVRRFTSSSFNLRLLKLVKQIKDSTKVKSIVLDLRGNAGGQTSKAMDLLSHFTDTTWALHDQSLIKGACLTVLPENTYIDRYLRRRIKKHGKEDWVIVKNEGGAMESSLIWGESSPMNSKTTLKDKNMVVLIDEGTFSAAAITAARLQDVGIKIIGVPSMCRVREMNMGVMKEFELPNTKLSYRIPLIHGTFNLKKREKGQLVPDIIEYPRIKKGQKNDDVILMRALEYLSALR